MTCAAERQLLIDAVGLALRFMYDADPTLAGRFLDRLVEGGVFTTEQALYLMDGLKESST